MFIDDVTVYKGRKRWHGAVAFRREKYVPRGGPAGGDGGKGGSVIFVGDEGLTTLLDFRYQKRIVAQNGENGRSKNQYGKDGADLYIKVPLGTTVTDLKLGAVIADITHHGQEAVIARGGRGGRGNTRFATPKIPAPEFAENGEYGEEKEIESN